MTGIYDNELIHSIQTAQVNIASEELTDRAIICTKVEYCVRYFSAVKKDLSLKWPPNIFYFFELVSCHTTTSVIYYILVIFFFRRKKRTKMGSLRSNSICLRWVKKKRTMTNLHQIHFQLLNIYLLFTLLVINFLFLPTKTNGNVKTCSIGYNFAKL